MLAGQPYNYHDPELRKERGQCRAALSKFKNTVNALEVLSAILKIRPRHHPPEANAANPIGSLGNNVRVRAPFDCKYGYNIHIGDHVDIGAGCKIMDICRVEIGAGAVLGQGVVLCGSNMIQVQTPKGRRGEMVGRPIFIGEDAFLECDVVIYAGVRVGEGSWILAGTVVHEDVEPFSVVAGKPARLVKYLR
ncbi:hypothetical protein W97_08395 [Coniosporium apollinis CBS 100218]|uniref:Maltose/galactoside acetyltransferase domain-containing protein n=1 Tax=Coniosporium apollinis (strain CBS 100218) TaxID=1168221 RepID=R7Z4J9_CONA1|nr:uncharacterized protein W97_08395 [Coniosporium apollinis CBS 100218]EON69082.1 hypothetical protein W97_08395 [Coniosporium apollinis CBS 100218]